MINGSRANGWGKLFLVLACSFLFAADAAADQPASGGFRRTRPSIEWTMIGMSLASLVVFGVVKEVTSDSSVDATLAPQPMP